MDSVFYTLAFLTFFNIKMWAKSKNIEPNEEFIVMRREEQSFRDVMSPLFQEKNEKDKSLKRLRFLIERPRSSQRRCSIKKMFLETSQNSQGNTCASVFFNKVAGLRACTCVFL